MIKRFETILLEEAFSFVQQQNIKTRKKIFQNIRRSENGNDPKFFKKLNKEIWEFRTLYNGIQYRLLAFWDKEDKTKTLEINILKTRTNENIYTRPSRGSFNWRERNKRKR